MTDREISRALVVLTQQGLAESSVRRFRASLSAFFAWAIRERLIATNPVTTTRVPRASTPRAEMFPLNEAKLELIVRRAAERNQRLSDILLIDAWTGFALVGEGGAHEGDEVGEDPADAGGGPRAAAGPRAGRGREGDALLFVTDSRSQLHASAFQRTLPWSNLAQGRRIHDLRPRGTRGALGRTRFPNYGIRAEA